MKLESLIYKCIQKDRAAEKELYLLYAKKIYGICLRYCRDDHKAKDYMQDSFVKIFSNLKKFNSSKGNFNAWVSTIVVNTILSDKRRKRIKEVETPIDEKFQVVDQIDDSILDVELNEKELLAAIRRLPMNQRDVVNLFVFENWSHKQIAMMLGIKESSSRSRYTRAKKLLKIFLSEKITILI